MRLYREGAERITSNQEDAGLIVRIEYLLECASGVTLITAGHVFQFSDTLFLR